MSIYKEINKELDKLYSKISKESFEWVNELEEVINILVKTDKIKDFIDILELVEDSIKDKLVKKRISLIIETIKLEEPEYLLDKLMIESEKAVLDKPKLKASINSQLYKIIEYCRTGKRADVIGIILRDFHIHKQEFPKELLEILKENKYNDDLFKAFIYAFLSNFLDNIKE